MTRCSKMGMLRTTPVTRVCLSDAQKGMRKPARRAPGTTSGQTQGDSRGSAACVRYAARASWK